jgi:hypothetical protein
MRAAPTLSTAGTFVFNDVTSDRATGTLILDVAGLQTVRIRTSGASGATTNRFYMLRASNDLTARFRLSAEL